MKCGQVEIKYRIEGDWELKKSTEGSSGYDLCAQHDYELYYGSPIIVRTGLYLGIPLGFEGQVRSRSGLALKGIFVLNSPGTIDSDYRGEVGVLLMKLKDSWQPYQINKGARIAQLVICKLPDVSLTPVTLLDTTRRQAGGFGSTGV